MGGPTLRPESRAWCSGYTAAPSQPGSSHRQNRVAWPATPLGGAAETRAYHHTGLTPHLKRCVAHQVLTITTPGNEPQRSLPGVDFTARCARVVTTAPAGSWRAAAAPHRARLLRLLQRGRGLVERSAARSPWRPCSAPEQAQEHPQARPCGAAPPLAPARSRGRLRKKSDCGLARPTTAANTGWRRPTRTSSPCAWR